MANLPDAFGNLAVNVRQNWRTTTESQGAHKIHAIVQEFTHVLDVIRQNTICVYKCSYTTVSSSARSLAHSHAHLSFIHLLLFVVCFCTKTFSSHFNSLLLFANVESDKMLG